MSTRRKFGAAPITEVLFTALTWLGALLMFAPIAWMILMSFKTEQDAVSYPPSSSSPRRWSTTARSSAATSWPSPPSRCW